MISMLTLLPALLTIFGRRAFWPFVPYGPEGAGGGRRDAPAPSHVPARLGFAPRDAALRRRRRSACSPSIGVPAPITFGGDRHRRDRAARRGAAVPRALPPHELAATDARAIDATHGRWRARRLDRPSPAPVWIGTTAAADRLRRPRLLDRPHRRQRFRDEVESVEGPELLVEALPGGDNAPTDVVVPDAAKSPPSREAVEAVAGRRGRSRPCAEGAAGHAICRRPSSPTRTRTEAFDLIPGSARRRGGRRRGRARRRARPRSSSTCAQPPARQG